MKEILLFSGGVDSYIAWHYLNKPQTLYVNMLHKYHKQELTTVTNLIPDTIIKELNLSEFEELDANIPMRNLYLAMLAANMGYSKIWLIVQKEEMSIPDRSIGFFEKSSQLLSFLNNRKIVINTPFKEMDKVDIVKWYKLQGLDLELLKETWACYSPVEDKPCINCGACIRRFISFNRNGIKEAEFSGIHTSEIAKLYLDRANKSYYSSERCNHIKESLCYQQS